MDKKSNIIASDVTVIAKKVFINTLKIVKAKFRIKFITTEISFLQKKF